jgi:hypothetical protein
MTTVVFVKKTCFICGTKDRYPDIGVIHIGKPEDLDGRPSDSHRSSIYMLMKRCTTCGYCAPDISTGPKNAAITVKEHLYQKQLNNTSFPETANAFLCWALLQKGSGNYTEAGKATLFAAWVCDDSSTFQFNARILRSEATALLLKAQELGQPFAKTPFLEQTLLIDLIRRAGYFDEALKYCKNTMKMNNLSEKEEMILAYQEELIGQKDTKRHTISEATSR